VRVEAKVKRIKKNFLYSYQPTTQYDHIANVPKNRRGSYFLMAQVNNVAAIEIKHRICPFPTFDPKVRSSNKFTAR
jgi:hypothetical protein